MSRTYKNERRQFFKSCKQYPIIYQRRSMGCHMRTNAARGIYEVEQREGIWFD